MPLEDWLHLPHSAALKEQSLKKKLKAGITDR